MKLNELIGIKHLKPDNIIHAEWPEFNDNHDNSNDVRGKINKWLMDHGYMLLGEGTYADVYSKPNINYVLKIVGFDQGYEKFIKIIKENPNIHFPKILKIVNVSRQKHIKIIKMEKLIPISKLEYDEVVNIYKYYPDRYESKLNQSDTLYEAFGTLLTKFPYLDMHIKNIMKRSDGTIIIIDPAG